MSVDTFRDLKVWKKGMNHVVEIYNLTKTFPKEEVYGLTNQMRRAAVSIPSNIAEGFGRHSTLEYVHHLRIAKGSLLELQTQTDIAMRLNYISNQEFEIIFSKQRELEAMLMGLISSLLARISKERAE